MFDLNNNVIKIAVDEEYSVDELVELIKLYLFFRNEGVLATVLERFGKHRLPMIIDIKNLVDQGG